MTLFFKERFKDAILKGTKIATIRNSKHLNVGTVFNVNLGTRFKHETIGKAECSIMAKLNKKDFFNSINSILPSPQILGFNTFQEAEEFYEKTLTKEYAFLHVFKLINKELENE